MKEKEIEKKEIMKKEGSAPAAVIEYAMAKGASVDELEKLLTLQERYDASQAKKAYNVAMAAFKETPPEISKDRTVKYKDVKYNHASLYNVTKKINSELSKHGLSASWITKQNGIIFVTCRITHKQGHSEETTLQAPADNTGSKNVIQAIGSTISYLCRYSLLCLTGLATYAQDNDGQSSEVVSEPIDDKQHHQIADLMADTNTSEDKFCTFFKIEKVSDLPKDKFNQALIALNAKKKGKTNTKG